MPQTDWRSRAGTTFRCEEQPATGTRGMVVTNHPLASAAGAEMLAAGGNAIDAAIAACFTLTVVEPMMVGILGGGIAHLRLANGRHVVIDNQSMAPMATGPTTYTPDPNAAPGTMDAIGRKNAVGPDSGRLCRGNWLAMDEPPIARIADHSDAPCTATTSIASSSTGKAITTSSARRGCRRPRGARRRSQPDERAERAGEQRPRRRPRSGRCAPRP